MYAAIAVRIGAFNAEDLLCDNVRSLQRRRVPQVTVQISSHSGKAQLTDLLVDTLVLLMAVFLSHYTQKIKAETTKKCDEYIQKLQKKAKKLSMKNIFIATLTHEIRNLVSK